jgi:hypothetical protein
VRARVHSSGSGQRPDGAAGSFTVLRSDGGRKYQSLEGVTSVLYRPEYVVQLRPARIRMTEVSRICIHDYLPWGVPNRGDQTVDQ